MSPTPVSTSAHPSTTTPLPTGIVDPRLVFTGISAVSLSGAFGEIAERLEQAGVVSDAADLARRLLERERLGSTGIGNGIAIPHCKLKEVDGIVLAVASCRPGVDFHAADGIPVTLMFLTLSPPQLPGLHLQALARLSRLLKSPGAADALRSAQTPDEIVSALRRADAQPNSPPVPVSVSSEEKP